MEGWAAWYLLRSDATRKFRTDSQPRRRWTQRHRQDDSACRPALHRRRLQQAESGRGWQHRHRLRRGGDPSRHLHRPRRLLHAVVRHRRRAQDQPDRLPGLRHLRSRSRLGHAGGRCRSAVPERGLADAGHGGEGLGDRGGHGPAGHAPPDQDGPGQHRLRGLYRRTAEELRPHGPAGPDSDRRRQDLHRSGGPAQRQGVRLRPGRRRARPGIGAAGRAGSPDRRLAGQAHGSRRGERRRTDGGLLRSRRPGSGAAGRRAQERDQEPEAVPGHDVLSRSRHRQLGPARRGGQVVAVAGGRASHAGFRPRRRIRRTRAGGTAPLSARSSSRP